GAAIGLLSAPGYMEDQQIMAFLAARLRERGLQPHFADIPQVEWESGRAKLNTPWYRGPLDGMIRFYQSEWLARFPRRFGWENFCKGGLTPIANPGIAAISESKRFPLVWPELRTNLVAWRRFLPESCAPREVNWQNDDNWLVKEAMSNTGDAVCGRA